jgi:hypothetical protein
VYDSDEYDEYESEEEDVRPSRGSSSRRGYGKGAVVVVSARGRGSRGPPAKPRYICMHSCLMLSYATYAELTAD